MAVQCSRKEFIAADNIYRLTHWSITISTSVISDHDDEQDATSSKP